MICHYWFFNHFEFQDYVCIGCHDLTILSVNISHIAIITVKNVVFGCIIHNISKSEGINLLKNSDPEDREYIYKKCCIKFQSIQDSFVLFLTFLFSIYKMVDSMFIHKPININIITMMKHPEMLKFVPDLLKTKQMRNYVAKKLPFVIRYVSNRYKT